MSVAGNLWVVDIFTGESLQVTGASVVVDFDSLSDSDRELFETGHDAQVAELAARVGLALEALGGLS